jgi:hypothetical protein
MGGTNYISADTGAVLEKRVVVRRRAVLVESQDHPGQVRIVGLGYTDEPQSQAMRKFFAEGNRWTLDRIAKPYWPKCAKCVAEEAATTATP